MKSSDLEQVQWAATAVCHALFRASNCEVRVTALMDKDGSFFIECAPHSWRGCFALSTVLDVAYSVKYAAKAMGISYRCNSPYVLPNTGCASEKHSSLLESRRNIAMKMEIEKEVANEK